MSIQKRLLHGFERLPVVRKAEELVGKIRLVLTLLAVTLGLGIVCLLTVTTYVVLQMLRG